MLSFLYKQKRMVAKYSMLEKNTYKRMFDNKSDVKEVNKIESSSGQELNLLEKECLENARGDILSKLKEFIENEKLLTLTVQLDAYSLNIINL